MKPYRLELKDSDLDKVRIIWSYIDEELTELNKEDIKRTDYHFPLCENNENYYIQINTYNPLYMYKNFGNITACEQILIEKDPSINQRCPYLPSSLLPNISAQHALFLASHICNDYKNIIYYLRPEALIHISDYALESNKVVDIYLSRDITMCGAINIQIKILNRLIAEISCYSFTM